MDTGEVDTYRKTKYMPLWIAKTNTESDEETCIIITIWLHVSVHISDIRIDFPLQ